jgi:hypothetical protein
MWVRIRAVAVGSLDDMMRTMLIASTRISLVKYFYRCVRTHLHSEQRTKITFGAWLYLPISVYVHTIFASLGSHSQNVHPLVIACKISGGSRSPKGSATHMGLARLIGTWMAQCLNLCLSVLRPPHLQKLFRLSLNSYDPAKSLTFGKKSGTIPPEREEARSSHLFEEWHSPV